MKILDCTLRDGGYYTCWDFDKPIVDAYIKATNALPIDYLEVGYRNNPSKEYLGKYGYCPVFELKDIREKSKRKLSVMLNEKNVMPDDLVYLLKPIRGLVDMVRIAIDPARFDRAVILAKNIKELGFEVGFNVMYMSKWKEYEGFFSQLNKIDDIADLFCMVDSFGGVSPEEVKEIFHTVKKHTSCPIGFHGHNNLQMGLVNTLVAIECGVDFVDATILGMGRGAGNLNMELLLTYLNKNGLKVDFNVLGDAITAFTPLYEKHRWGTMLPYMLSGANSLPQKKVMDWVSNRTYSFNSVVRALDNMRSHVEDNAKYPLLQHRQSDKIFLIGGGNSVVEHVKAVREYLFNNQEISIVFASARHAEYYTDLPNIKYYCLVGNEAKRLASNVPSCQFEGTCILGPYPRIMGTEVPDYAIQCTFELPAISFTKQYLDSCTTIALQIAICLKATCIEIIGYDGYMGGILSEKEMGLTRENRILFNDFKENSTIKIKSLTPTLYKELDLESIYQFL